MRKILLIGFMSVCTVASAQITVDSAGKIYRDQFEQIKSQHKELLISRSLNESESEKIIQEYATNGLSSPQDFGRLIRKMYRFYGDAAFLLYLYNNDTLSQYLFNAGGHLEQQRNLRLNKEELHVLQRQLGDALDLQRLTANRAARSSRKNPVPGASIDVDSITRVITQLLIPNRFDQRFKHLVVIPCLNIGSFPFQLLKPYGDSSYLIDRSSITVTPNLIDLVALRKRILLTVTNTDNESLWDDQAVYQPDKLFQLSSALFISNPEYPADTAYVFPDLPGAVREVDSVAKLFSSAHILSGSHATRKNLMAELGKHDLVYFATHGISDPDDPLYKNFLVLSGKDPYFTSKEIVDLRLITDEAYRAPKMVVLSACQTGLGKPMEAGIMGSLSRSFLLAGSLFVVESLWSVDDDATAFLMSRFLHYLKSPEFYQQDFFIFPSGALRMAMLDTKKIYSNPAYWAGFSVIGGDY